MFPSLELVLRVAVLIVNLLAQPVSWLSYGVHFQH